MSLRQKIVSGVLWQTFERVGNTGMSFIVSIILARLLSPQEFGTIAIMMVFVKLSVAFIDSGFSSALIQKKDLIQDDYCSVFFLNISIAAIIYILLFFSAPLIASFYDTADLSLYIRVFLLIIIIRSFSVVQTSVLNREMLFNLSFKISWVAHIISGFVGITMAYLGCGVWSLIFQQMVSAVVTVVMQWIIIKWRPQLIFNFERTREMFRFGSKIFCVGFLEIMYNEVYSLIIGKVGDMETLSYYDRGKMYPLSGMTVVNSSVSSVMLSAFSKIQDNHDRMKSVAREALRSLFFFVTPIIALLFVFADSIVLFLLTDKWLPCVPYMRLCCLIYIFSPIRKINLLAITASGKSNIVLALEVINDIQAVVIIFIMSFWGIKAIVLAGVFLSLLASIQSAWYNHRLMDYGLWEQTRTVMPYFLIAIISSVISYCSASFFSFLILKLCVGFIVFGGCYVLLCCLMKSFPNELMSTLKNRFALH